MKSKLNSLRLVVPFLLSLILWVWGVVTKNTTFDGTLLKSLNSL